MHSRKLKAVGFFPPVTPPAPFDRLRDQGGVIGRALYGWVERGIGGVMFLISPSSSVQKFRTLKDSARG